MKRLCIVFTVFIVCLLAVSATAHTPKGGLGAVAISPDGKTLVVGGDNRVLYVLDAANHEVLKRIWLKTNIYEMEFNSDGSTLVVEDTKEILRFIDTASWKVMNQVKNAGNFSAAPGVDLLAGMKPSYKLTKIYILSMKDGKRQKTVEHAGNARVIGLSPKGDRLVVLADGPRDMEEKKKPGKNLRGLERAKFLQYHDGRTSVLAEYDLASGKQTKLQTVFYAPGGYKGLLVRDDASLVLSYSNLNAVWQGDKVELMHSQNSYNYGAGISPDQNVFLTGGLRDGTLVQADGLKMVKFGIDSLPGWPEYYLDFAVGPDGTGYGVTTAYRLVVISPQGKLIKAAPIY